MKIAIIILIALTCYNFREPLLKLVSELPLISELFSSANSSPEK